MKKLQFILTGLCLLITLPLLADNYSLNFDGVDDDVDIYLNNGSTILNNTPCTISFWFKLNDISNDNTPLIVSHEYPEDNFFQFKKIFDNQKLAFHVRDDTHGIEETLYSLDQIENDVWKFTTATVDQNCIKFYINGVLQDSIPNTNNYDFINSSNRILFAHSYRILGGSFTNTNLDEVSLWSRALSQQEIIFYMNTPPQGNENDIVGCWNFNEGVGDIAYDSTIYGNNGVVNGATWSTDVPPIQHELLSLPTDVTGAPSCYVSIPLDYTNIDSTGIEGIEVTISYDNSILWGTGATLTGTVLENEDYGIQYNTISDSLLNLWIYANGDLFTGGGTVAYLEFMVDQSANAGDYTELIFEEAEVNEDSVSTSNGLFTVEVDFQISLPIDVGAAPGAQINIPINVNNYNNIGIEGVETIIRYDNDILNATGATLTGGILENQNYGIQTNTGADSITIWIYANGDLYTGGGIVAYIEFDVDQNAVIGNTSELEFIFAEINENPVGTEDGLFTVLESYSISGNTLYYYDQASISNAIIQLEQSKYEAISDTTGYYEILNIPTGDYISSASKNDELGGLSSLDASRIARYGVGLYYLTEYEIIAADVSLNASVSPLDASRVARYGVGLINELNDDNIHWVFVADSVDSSSWPPIYYETFKYYTPLNTDMTNEDFVGVRLGDVTGNWSPSKRKLITGTKDISATLPEVTGAPTDTVTVTLDVFGLENLEGMDITITFNEQVIDALGATLNGGILKNENFGYQVNTNNDNEIILWIYALGDPFSGGGTVALIDFEVV